MITCIDGGVEISINELVSYVKSIDKLNKLKLDKLTVMDASKFFPETVRLTKEFLEANKGLSNVELYIKYSEEKSDG